MFLNSLLVFHIKLCKTNQLPRGEWLAPGLSDRFRVRDVRTDTWVNKHNITSNLKHDQSTIKFDLIQKSYY